MSIESIKSALRQDRQAVFLVELNLNGRTIRICDRPGAVNLEDFCFDGVISSISPVGTSFDLRTFRSASTTVKVETANAARYQDQEVYPGIEGGTGRIWLWTESLTWDDIEPYPIWAGSLKGEPWDKAKYGFSLVDHSFDRGLWVDGVSLDGHFADQVGYLWQALTTLTADELHPGSIATLAQLRPGMIGTVQVDKGANVFDVSDRVLSVLKAARIQRWGRQAVASFDLAGPVVAVLKDEDFLTSAPKGDRSPRDMICNDLKISYAWNTGTSGFDHTVTLDRFNNALCAASVARHGAFPQRELWVGDATTEAVAAAAGALHLDWFALRKRLLPVSVRHAEGFDLFEGDKARITAADAATEDGAGWVDEECILLQRQFHKTHCAQVWMKVSD